MTAEITYGAKLLTKRTGQRATALGAWGKAGQSPRRRRIPTVPKYQAANKCYVGGYVSIGKEEGSGKREADMRLGITDTLPTNPGLGVVPLGHAL